MTFIAPSSTARSFGDVIRPLPFLHRGIKSAGRIHAGHEDGARRALGADSAMPTPALPGISLEHLARIALG